MLATVLVCVCGHAKHVVSQVERAGTVPVVNAYVERVDPSRADLLLDSPLGRQFLAGFLGFEFGQELLDQLGLGQVPGTVALTAGGVQHRAPGRRRRWQDVAPHEAGAVIRAAVAQGEWRGLLGLDEVMLLAALADDTFGFGEDEAVQALTALAKQELRPVAGALVSAPGTRRWWEPVVRGDQRFLEWDDGPHPAGPAVEQAVRDSMREERAENAKGLKQRRRRERRGTRIGAVWWSAPDFAAQTWTTGAFGDVPAIALGHFIDTFTPFEETGATVWSLQIAPQARVLEIRAPADWQALVLSFPRDVTGTHDGEWRYWGGVPGPWRLPAWEQVMEHYDGVHVTIGGYVASCGLALPAGDGYTMLAGWIPDATLWLRDVTAGHRRLGRWEGHPQGGRGWDDIRAGWTPEAQ